MKDNKNNTKTRSHYNYSDRAVLFNLCEFDSTLNLL